MVWRDPFSSVLSRRERLRFASLLFCVVVMCAVVTGCGRQSPGAPDMRLLTISGYVYSLEVSAGIVAITASKPGYVARVSHVDVSDDTVLNFSLMQG
jgi:hypothetical protein